MAVEPSVCPDPGHCLHILVACGALLNPQHQATVSAPFGRLSSASHSSILSVIVTDGRGSDFVRKKFSWRVGVTAVAVTISMIAAPAAQAAPSGDDLTRAQSQALYDKIEKLLPKNAEAKLAALRDRLNIPDTDPRDAIEAIIDPKDYVCAETEVAEYVREQTAGLNQTDLLNLTVILMLDPVTYDALFFPEPEDDRYFGVDGEYSNRIHRTFRGLSGFWDIDASRIELVPAHGSTLLDNDRVARALKLTLGVPQVAADDLADSIGEIVDQDKFDHGDNPLFTFNAFAFSAEGAEVPGVGEVSDKIVMGDGVLDGMRDLGLNDVAPDAILAHEFGHHLQYQDGLADSELPAPEASRRLELMADTFGSYFLTHADGKDFGVRRVKDFVRMFYDLGDCQFTSAGHHGTPDQRAKAAEFGSVNSLLPPDRVLPSRTIAKRFEKALPRIVAPDVETMTPEDAS
jgi:hypothetical protein